MRQSRSWGRPVFRLAALDLINRAAVALITFHYELFSVHAVALHADFALMTAGSAVHYRNWYAEGVYKNAKRRVVSNLDIHLSRGKGHYGLLYGMVNSDGVILNSDGVIFSSADATA
jgi:hypothetical protein